MSGWRSPLPLRLIASADRDSFRITAAGETVVPLPPHPGAFAAVRAHHVHEGVDLYCPEGTCVTAVEDGEVVAIVAFTGPRAGSPFWLDTDAVLVEGATGVVVYGELAPSVVLGASVRAGDPIGRVQTVLRKDKGRPRAMLHLELHITGTRDAPEWPRGGERPATLRDPTPFLLAACT